MKGIIKLIIVIGILIAIFGVATVKKWTLTGIDAVDKGVNAVKSSGVVDKYIPKPY